VNADVDTLTLTGLRHRCALESDRFFKRREHDPRFCFELFRRAICHRNELAWEYIYAQYRPLVAGWVQRHPLFPAVDGELEEFVLVAFEKMWKALTPKKFEDFSELKALLGYLRMCVHSAVVDSARTKERDVLLERTLGDSDPWNEDPNRGKRSDRRLEREEFWRWLSDRLKNEKEQRIVYGTFILALKPRELYAQYQDTFSSIEDVRRVKENVIARLRRDKELRAMLGDA
jgi:DNA-directed RNA polymerase specialized sigma24 family protein